MNLFELFVKIGVDDQASDAVSKITQGLGSGLATAAKIGTAAVGTAATGIAALTKGAVDNYAEYEQLVGGVETLFKESADTVMANADRAFQSAGLSANEYMETVTSFSASLLQSTGRGAQTDLEALENTLTEEYEAAKETYSDMYKARKEQLAAEYAAAKESYDAEYAALKAAQDAALAEYSKAADEKIASIDKANKEAIAAAKQEKKDTLAALKAGNKKELDELKASNKKKLEEQKAANAADLEDFKDANDKKLDYQKAAIKDQVAFAEEANSISVTTLESQALAAELADQAIIDMSDNANKMGTDMAMIQNAYQGFAKANYTMLDNLKLGYGGTQAEMKRLIADAAKLSDTVDAQSMSFANVVQAIHVVQTEMGITGTTAKEAGETIAGSAAAMKSAWQNLVTEVATGEGDIEQAFANFTDSAGTYAENLLPRIEVALGGVSTLIESAAGKFPDIVNMAIDGIEEKLPNLLDTGGKIVGTVVGAVLDNAPQLLNTGVEILTNFARGVTENLQNGSLLNATSAIIDTAVGFLTNRDGKLTEFAGAASEMVVALNGYLKDSASKIWDGAKEVAISFVAWFSSEEGQATLDPAGDKIVSHINASVKKWGYKAGEAGYNLAQEILNGISSIDWSDVGAAIVSDISTPLNERNTIVGATARFMDSFVAGWKDAAMPETPDSVTSQQAKAGWHVGMQDDVLAGEIPAGVRGNVYVTQNIYSQAQTAADLMEEAQYEQQRALLQP